MSLLLFDIFLASAIHAVLVRFSEDPGILRDLVRLEEDLEEDGVGVNVDPLRITCVRRAVWGMLYADGVGIASKSAEGLDGRHHDRFRSSRPRRVREEDEDHAAADTEPGTPNPTAGHRSSRPEV